MYAYCAASGHIFFGKRVSHGMLPIARGVAKTLRPFIETTARWSYPDEDGKEHPLVPGIPEAPNQIAALEALEAYLGWIGSRPPEGVVVFTRAHRLPVEGIGKPGQRKFARGGTAW